MNDSMNKSMNNKTNDKEQVFVKSALGVKEVKGHFKASEPAISCRGSKGHAESTLWVLVHPGDESRALLAFSGSRF